MIDEKDKTKFGRIIFEILAEERNLRQTMPTPAQEHARDKLALRLTDGVMALAAAEIHDFVTEAKDAFKGAADAVLVEHLGCSLDDILTGKVPVDEVAQRVGEKVGAYVEKINAVLRASTAPKGPVC